MEINLDDWCKCTTNGVVTEEDRAIQHMMQMDFPLSDPRGHLVRPRKVLKYDGDMPYYDIVLCPVDDIAEPKVSPAEGRNGGVLELQVRSAGPEDILKMPG